MSGFESRSHYNLLFTTPSPVSETFSHLKMKVEPLRGQRFEKISRHHKKLGVPWTDPTFPANDSSIGLRKVTGSDSKARVKDKLGKVF